MTTNLKAIRPEPEILDAFAKELDQIRDQTKAKVGQHDADYIRKIVRDRKSTRLNSSH